MIFRKIFSSIVIVLLLSSTFFLLVQFPLLTKAESENWLIGWNYRKSLIVSTGIHVIIAHFDSGNDVLGHTYMNGLCQSDFDDIRFSGSDGKTLISEVTIRAKVNSDHVEYKVDVTDSPIYMYYGNLAASLYYANETFGSGFVGDTHELLESYVTSGGGEISGITIVSPVTGFATSLEAEISTGVVSTARMALLLMNDCLEEIEGVRTEGKRIVATTETKPIAISGKHREVFEFETPVPIFKGTRYGIALWAGAGITVWYQTGTGTGSFSLAGGFNSNLVFYTAPLGTRSYGRIMNYMQVDGDEQNLLFKDNADFTRSHSLWHHRYENNGTIDAEAGQGIDNSYVFKSTVTPIRVSPIKSEAWGELSFLGEIANGNKRFWSSVVRLSALPDLDTHVELMANLYYNKYIISLNGFGVNRTETGAQWILSAKSGVGVWSHTLFGEVEVDTDYLVILSYETGSGNAKSEVWVTKLSEPDLLVEASPSANLTVSNNVLGNMFFIGAADYPLHNVSPISAFFDEITLTENFPITFGAWGSEEVSAPIEFPKFTSEGVVSGASYSHDPISPGSISSVFGENLALEIASAEMIPLPRTLGGTIVYLDDIECPLYYVSPEQINFQVPYELEGVSVASMVIECDGIISGPVSIAIASVNLGIFTTNMQGTGDGCILHNSDSSLVTSINPATRGEYLQIYCTGLGLVTPAVETGEDASSDPLCYTLATPVLTIGGIETEVVYSGLAPGFVGLYQVNVQVPDTAPVGETVSLVMSVAGLESNLVTLAIKSR